MSNRYSFSAAILALAAGLGASSGALAADPLTDAMQEAYVPYRVALFKTNSNAQGESQQAIGQAQQSWRKLIEQFGTQPPAPYDRDSAVARSLGEVSRVYTKAAEQVAANQLAEAHETLEAARDIMAELRHRNHVVIYSDYMNDYHAQMEKVLIEGPKILARPDGMQQLAGMVGALDYLVRKLAGEAPAKFVGNAEFDGLIKDVGKSVADLQAAVFAQDATRVKESIGKVKQPYSKLFLKFG